MDCGFTYEASLGVLNPFGGMKGRQTRKLGNLQHNKKSSKRGDKLEAKTVYKFDAKTRNGAIKRGSR